MSWQRELAAEVAGLVAAPTYLHGSVATGDVDLASDLDLVTVLPDLRDWQISRLDSLGERWAWQHLGGHDEIVERICLSDGRMLDLRLIADETHVPDSGHGRVEPARVASEVEPGRLASEVGSAPLASEVGSAPLASEVETARLASGAVPTPSLSGTAPLHPTQLTDLQRVRMLAAQACVKAARNDLLIAGHHVLEIARETLVLGMQLRDRELGTTIHRFGGAHNDVWRQVIADLYEPRDVATSHRTLARDDQAAMIELGHRLLAGYEMLAHETHGEPQRAPDLEPYRRLAGRLGWSIAPFDN